MDITRWKSLAVAIKTWQDVWAMKNLPEFKYLRPGAIISTLVDQTVTELARKEKITEDEWRKKYYNKFNGTQYENRPAARRKRHL
jgi:hypothetical protein